jgi:glycosyltransferase involved in cell wall biosynthesis
MSISDKDLTSIIIRTHSPHKINLLEEAIRSIHNNSYRPVEIIVVIQSKESEFVEQVKRILCEYIDDYFHGVWVVNPTNQNDRAKNLNLGISRASGRYIGFLDEDDIYLENSLLQLVSLLRRDESIAWAYGETALVSYELDGCGNLLGRNVEFPFSRPNFSLATLFHGNFIPINSYLIDRSKIDSSILRFDESYPLAEDYEFLIRLASAYEPRHLDEVVSEYRVFSDLSNSNLLLNEKLGIPDKDKIKEWSYALWRIEILKEALMPSYSSGILSLKIRKYIFYKFPDLKILLQYTMPRLRQALVELLSALRLMAER